MGLNRADDSQSAKGWRLRLLRHRSSTPWASGAYSRISYSIRVHGSRLHKFVHFPIIFAVEVKPRYLSGLSAPAYKRLHDHCHS